MPKLPTVLWKAMVYNPNGLAEEARELLKALKTDELNLILLPVESRPGFTKFLDPQEHHFLLGLESNRQLKPDVVVEQLPAFMFEIEGAIPHIGRTMFETDRLDPSWVQKCREMDEIWVPTEFNRLTFSESGVDPDKIRVVPIGLDPAAYSEPVEPLEVHGRQGFTFLSSFDLTLRKGWDLLLRAYLDVFTPRDEVTLILKIASHNTLDAETVIARFITQTLGRDLATIPNLIVLKSYLPAKELRRLYQTADAFVLPSRGEGWGLPLMEAMASGLPTIGTRWSGNLAFMNDDNSYLIDIKGLVEVPPTFSVPHFRGHRWAEPDLDSLRHLLRHVFEERAAAARVGEQAKSDILNHWTHHQAAERVLMELRKFA